MSDGARSRLLSLLRLQSWGVVAALVCAPQCHADNTRLNDSVIANVYTIQRHSGCSGDLRANPKLQMAAMWHARDIMAHRHLDGDLGSDGSTPQDRALAAGFRGEVAQTVAVNPALAISGIEILQRWYYDPRAYAIMSDCTHTAMAVWSENSWDRTVVVAVYGRPA